MLQQPAFDVLLGMKDPTGSSVKTITHLHSKIHSGKAFKACFTSSATTDGAVVYLQINGSSDVDAHLKEFNVHTSEGFLDIKFIECSTSSTHTTGSASVSVYDKNRTTKNSANITFFSDPTDVNSTASNNIVIDRFQVGGTAGSSLTPTGSQINVSQDEWVIGNSTYIIEITCQTTAASFYLNGCLIFYE